MSPVAPARSGARRRGFTLIELIVVVIIIAVLAAVAAVAYNQYASKARSNAVLASATSLRTAVMAASARDDEAPAAEVDALWTAAGGEATAFLSSLSASYDGPLAYTAAADGSPATLQVGAAAGGSHAACLSLPLTVSQPVTLAAGECAAGSSSPAAPGDTGAAGGTGPAAAVADTFDRADDGTGLGVTSTGAFAWVPMVGTVGIKNNTAYAYQTVGSFAVAAAYVPLDSADMDVQADPLTANSGLAVRVADAQNYWRIVATGGRTYLETVNGGGPGIVASCGLTGHTEVTAVGDTLTVTVGGAACVSTTSSYLDTATGAGVWFGATDATVDNFSASTP